MWRLACATLSFDAVLNGPSPMVHTYGKGSRYDLSGYSDDPSSYYWDDALDEGELDVICGLHFVETGKSQMAWI